MTEPKNPPQSKTRIPWSMHRRAIILALIVGTILNCINQAPEIMDGQSPNFLKIGLTFMVPYCVSIYSAMAAAKSK